MNCEQCGTPLRRKDGLDGETMQTLVGYGKGPCGQYHDDNCQSRGYICENGHTVWLSVQRKCSACDWIGKLTCFCHKGEKLAEWPADGPGYKPFDRFAWQAELEKRIQSKRSLT